jgi:hypothetical protein
MEKADTLHGMAKEAVESLNNATNRMNTEMVKLVSAVAAGPSATPSGCVDYVKIVRTYHSGDQSVCDMYWVEARTKVEAVLATAMTVNLANRITAIRDLEPGEVILVFVNNIEAKTTTPVAVCAKPFVADLKTLKQLSTWECMPSFTIFRCSKTTGQVTLVMSDMSSRVPEMPVWLPMVHIPY